MKPFGILGIVIVFTAIIALLNSFFKLSGSVQRVEMRDVRRVEPSPLKKN